MLSAEHISPLRAMPMLRSTYHRLGELGEYEGRRVQLICGTIIDMSPMGSPHANAIRVLNRYFVTHAPESIDVMVQLPLAVAEDSEPEPDFAFVSAANISDVDHPASALLVVEIADSSLKLDLGPKVQLYAQCGVPEYWVIDLKSRVTVVHTSPRRRKYARVQRISWASWLTSKTVSGLEVRLAEVLR